MKNKILTGWASYYHPNDSTGSTEFLAMQTVKTCSDCGGSGKNSRLLTDTYAGQFSINCPRCRGDGELRNRVKYDPDFQGIALPESIVDYFGRPSYMAKFRISYSWNPEAKKYPNGYEIEPFCYAWYNDKMADWIAYDGTHNWVCHNCHTKFLNITPSSETIKNRCDKPKIIRTRVCDLQLGTTKALGLDLKQGLWHVKLTLIG
jgi:hypothetical protein